MIRVELKINGEIITLINLELQHFEEKRRH